VAGFFNILDPKVAKPWRDNYLPYFSKSALNRLEPLIKERTQQFLSQFESAAESDRSIDLSMGFRSLTSDNVTSYMFADNGFGLLDVKDFKSPLLAALEEFFELAQYTMKLWWLMPFLTRQLQKMSYASQKKYIPALAATNWITTASFHSESAVARADVGA
jgi:cytochrome P450